MDPYVVLEKNVGETPLAATEAWRAKHPQYAGVPLAYAGRLDPMASGKLLILIGDECKKQSTYHGLDKEYEFSVLFGVSSDTADVLGRLNPETTIPEVTETALIDIANNLIGECTFPYPHFSSKTVHGKPLHMWTLEGRLSEIEIPTITSNIFDLKLLSTEQTDRITVATKALEKIETIPPVTDPRKALGKDFRRTDIRQDWQVFRDNASLPAQYTIATFSCAASSGTYMRSLAELIAKEAGTTGLAWHIHRTLIGRYDQAKKDWSLLY